MIIINRSRYLDTSTYHYSMCRSISISRLRLFVIDWNVFSMIRWRSSIWIITCAISTKYITAESIKSKINISLIHFNNSFRLWIFRRFLFLRQQDEQDEKKRLHYHRVKKGWLFYLITVRSTKEDSSMNNYHLNNDNLSFMNE